MTKHKFPPKVISDALLAAPRISRKIQPLYALLGWTWGNSKVPPTDQEITNQIIKMVSDVAVGGHSLTSTGGLTVSYASDTGLVISFSKEYYTCTPDDEDT